MPDDRPAHPEEMTLLAHLDGELASAESERVAGHLLACWNCRMHADALGRTIVAYTRYRARWPVPAPPRPWKDLAGDFREPDLAVAGLSLWTRLRELPLRRGPLRRRPMFRVAAACGVVAMAATAWLGLPRSPSPPLEAPPVASITPRPTAIPVPNAPRTPDHALANRTPPMGLHEEVAVIAALHRIGADLGEPIELAREPNGRMLLGGIGLPPDRQNTIRETTSAIRGLDLRFVNPTPRAADSSRSAAPATARRTVAFLGELTALLGGKEAVERFTNAVLDSSDAAVSRAYALRNLNERFGPSAQLDPHDRAIVDSMRTDHEKHLQESVIELQRLLQPVFARLGVPPRAVPPATVADSATKVDRLLNAALAGAQSDLSDRELYSELEGWLARLLEWSGQ